MTTGALLKAAASLLTVELFDEMSEELLVPEPLLEYEQLLEYEPPSEERLVRFLLLVYPDFSDQLLCFLLVELSEEPLCFVLVYPDLVLAYLNFLPANPDSVLICPDSLLVVELESLLPFEGNLEVSLSEYTHRGVDYPSQSRLPLAAHLGLADCRLR